MRSWSGPAREAGSWPGSSARPASRSSCWSAAAGCASRRTGRTSSSTSELVLLERGGWVSCETPGQDELINQRATVLGNAYGPDDRSPRVVEAGPGKWDIVMPNEGGYSNNAACVGSGTVSYGAMAWRYMEKDFRMRSTRSEERR